MKYFILPLLLIMSCPLLAGSTDKIRVLIIDGQNNHTVWPKSTMMMKQYLEESGRFTVEVSRTAYTWKGEKWLPAYPLQDGRDYKNLPEPKADPDYKPDFSKYDVVVSNFGWQAAELPVETRAAMEAFVAAGGGFVSVHAADNAWPSWEAYNRMIGLGGWGGRTEKDGPYVYYDNAGKLVRDTSPGRAGSHGALHEFLIQIRDPDHPITRGMPEKWLHAQDECYDRLRGPAQNMSILATAFSSMDKGGTGRHEPMLMVIEFGKGRIFHTPLGHEDYSFEGVGLITSLLRGCEWAATGEVTLPIPDDFPTADVATSRPFDGK